MAKTVVVIASGETERRSLPHLVAHLESEGIAVVEVRVPPGAKALTVEMAEKLVKASWFEWVHAPPDKFVILLDADGKDPNEVLHPLQKELPNRLKSTVTASLQFACAQWHLEAWYFADAANLRDYLKRDLGKVDAPKPDEIPNPKNHLVNLLGQRAYTAVVAEEIARRLSAKSVAQRSPSFQGFLAAVRNGS